MNVRTIKDRVKEIFQTRTFDEALETTRDIRKYYIEEYGVKSWNAMVAYYKKANIQPEPIVAEPIEEVYDTEVEEEAIEENVDDLLPFDEAREIEPEPETEVVEHEVETCEEEPQEKVEYMVYRNSGKNLEFYGHQVNYKNLSIGEEDMMIRMFNLGIGKGKVIATASLTIEEVGLFHSIYANIRKRKISEEKMVEQFAFCLNHLHDFLVANKITATNLPADKNKLVNQLLIFGM